MPRRFLLREEFVTSGDLIEIMIRLRVRISRNNKLVDILTRIRGIEHVVTANQEGLLEKAPDKRRMLNMKLKYENSMKDFSEDELLEKIMAVEGVDMASVIEDYASSETAPEMPPEDLDLSDDEIEDEETPSKEKMPAKSGTDNLTPAEKLIRDLVSEIIKRNLDIV